MIEILMFGGIGLLAGVLLMLLFIPIVHERAVRLTERRLAEATPLTITEMQADKDALRAEFAMSVRRLELGMDELRAKSADRRGEVGNNAAEDQPSLCRARQEDGADPGAAGAERGAEARFQEDRQILLYLYMRSKRRPRPVLVVPEQHPLWELTGRAGPSELAAAAALNVKRRQAVSRSH